MSSIFHFFREMIIFNANAQNKFKNIDKCRNIAFDV